MVALGRRSDAAMLTEDLPDGAGGARQAQAQLLEGRVMGEVVQDGFGTGRALEVGWGRIADGENALDDDGVEARGRLGAGARAAVQDLVIVGRRVAKAFEPFLDPGERAVGGIGIVLEGSCRVELEKRAQERAVGEPVVFHRSTSG